MSDGGIKQKLARHHDVPVLVLIINFLNLMKPKIKC